MALNLQQYIEPAAFASAVYDVTGQMVDSAIASGYAQWIKGITGTMPVIVKTDDTHVKIVFTQAQIPVMRKWLDDQLKGAVKPSAAGPVTYDFGSVLNMWAAKYAVPTVAGIFIGGVLLGYIAHKMRWF